MIETRFKQTEVGAIPEDWEVKRLGEIAKLKAGKSLTKEDLNKSGIYPCYGGGGIRNFLSFYSHDLKCSIIGRQGEWCGNVTYATGKFYATEHAVVTTTYLEDSKWLYYVLIKANLNQYATGCAQPGLSVKIICDIPISIPPLPEQTRIAAALTSIDNLITSLLALIEKKKQLKQGTMQQLLTGKRRLPGFSGTWVEKKLGEICEFGNGYTPSKEVASFWTNGTIPWFRMEDIRTNGRVLSDSIQHITKIAVKGQLFPSNSIIISTTATIGEHALIIVDSLANQQFTNLKIRKSLSKSISIDWLFHYCFVLGEWCRNNINEGGLAAVNMDDFSSHEMIMPPTFSEQTAIANVLTAMDNEIAALEAKRAKYEAIKQGMMQQLLTGRVRLCALHSGHCETQTNDKIASQSPQ